MIGEARRVLRVFLASPGDVTDERRAAKEVVDSLNRSLTREIGWEIDLLGWEDTLPGHGRPQELINREVDVSDLFIGILWARWGSPTGAFGSGFEEEYRRAAERLEKAGTPEIWMFFKKVDAQQAADPGVQLQSVLAFRKEMEVARSGLLKDFDTEQEWRAQLSEYLLRFVLRNDRLEARGNEASPEAADAEPLDSPVPSGGPRTLGEDDPSIQQALSVLTSTATDLQGVTRAGTSTSSERLTPAEVARLFLTSSALLSRDIVANTLGVHELNLAYLHRREIAPLPIELTLILRSVIRGESAEAFPGWFWIRLAPDPALTDFLFGLLRDSDPAVAEGALILLTRLHGTLPRNRLERRIHLWEVLLLAPRARDAVVEYLSNVLAERDLEEVAAAQLEIGFPEAAYRDLRIATLARVKTPQAWILATAAASPLSSSAMTALSRYASRASTRTLRAALSAPRPELQCLALEQLSARNALAEDELINAIENGASEARRAAIKSAGLVGGPRIESALRRLIEEIDSDKNSWMADREALMLEAMSAMSTDSLSNLVEWYSTVGARAYRVLAVEHFPLVADRVRRDLSDGFFRIRSRAIRDIESRIRGTDDGSELSKEVTIQTAIAAVLKQWSDLDPFFERLFSIGALQGIAYHGDRADAVLVRPFLSSALSDVRLEAKRAIGRVGSQFDARRLFKEFPALSGEEKLVTITSCLQLDTPGRVFANRLLQSGDADAVIVAVGSLAKAPQDHPNLLEDQLRHPDPRARKAVLSAIFSGGSSGEDLEGLLTRYTSNGTYFYNVVTWLDRILYAPGDLRRLYRDELAPSGRYHER